MIIREAAIDSHWYRAAGSWFIAFLITICLAFPAFDSMGYGLARLWPLLWIGAAGTSILYLIGKVRPKTPQRVLVFILVIGCFGIIPLELAIALCGMSYFLLTPHVNWLVWLVRIAFVVAAILWSWREVRAFHKRVVERRFLQKEFRVEDDRITISRTPRTNIERPPVTDDTLFGKAFNHLGPYVGVLMPMGYPLQRLLKDSGGVDAVLLFIAIPLIPLAIHTLSQIICGAYLWVYLVWRIEREHGKPVMFATP